MARIRGARLMATEARSTVRRGARVSGAQQARTDPPPQEAGEKKGSMACFETTPDTQRSKRSDCIRRCPGLPPLGTGAVPPPAG